MALPPTSSLQFLDLTGRPILAPREWTPALIELVIPTTQWSQAALLINGQPQSLRLERCFGAERVLVSWPRSGTGNYQVKLSLGKYLETAVITVRPEKISEAAYAVLIEDLESRLPVSIAFGLKRIGGLAGIQLESPEANTLAQEVQRLRRAIDGVEGVRPGLVAILQVLSYDHHHVLQTRAYWVERHQARRPTTTGLVQALVKSGNLDKSGQPVQVIDQRVEHTVDVYENRLIKLYHHQVNLRLRAAIATAQARQDPELLRELDALESRLVTARRQAQFLDEVTLPDYWLLNMTMVLMRRDPYRAAVEGYLEFNRNLLIKIEEAALEAPLENLPQLYQTWGLLEVMDALLAYAHEHGFYLKKQRLVERRHGELYVRVIPDGQPCLVLTHPESETQIRLIPEFSIGRKDTYHSVSFSQRPDIVIEIDQAGYKQLIVLDPKYKLDSEFISDEGDGGKPKKVDIDKMHAYRDAIRDVHNRRVVTFAGILYPGGNQYFGEEIGALNALPSNNQIIRVSVYTLVNNVLCTNNDP